MRGFSHLSFGLVLAVVFLPSQATAAEKPNFLIILTDDQSWVGTSLLIDPEIPESKSDYYQTPHLDKLALSGMRFTQGYASGAWCTPSRRSIQVAQSPSRHIYNVAPDENQAGYAKLMSLPRVLKAADPAYRCAHFGKWHLQYDTVTPAVMGYDVSDGDTENADGDLANQPGFQGKATAKDSPDVSDDPKTVLALNQRAVSFIEQQHQAKHPWMVQISEYAVHLKIAYRQATFDRLAGRPKGEKHAVQEFAAMTEDLDAAIGELMEQLEKLGALQNTYVIFLSDNGGRGKMPVAGKPDHESEQGRNYPLAESKHSIYEGGLRVPFFISGPGIKSAGVSRVPVWGVDILPTIADLAGYTESFGNEIDGGSLKPVLLGQAERVKRPHPFLVFHSKGGELPRHGRTKGRGRPAVKAAIRRGDHKLVKFYDPDEALVVTELYDLSQDIGEAKDISKEFRGVARRLEQLLDEYLEEVGGITKQTPKNKRD